MIIKLMDNAKALTALVSDQTNGLGRLPEATEACVSEEYNGLYDLSFTIPNTAEHFSDIANGSIVKAKVADGSEQMFRVYQMTKQMNGLVRVDCHHITYDLNKAPVSPFSSVGASAAVNGLVSHLMASYPFTISTDVSNTTSEFSLDIPRSFRECLGGYSGSILDVFGGEYEWNNLEVILHAHRGTDKGVRIAYGKNLVDLEQEENIEAVYDAVVGYAVVSEQTYQGSIVYTNGVVSNPKVQIVDFSTEYGTETPTVSSLDDKAAAYIQANQIGTPKVSFDVEFSPLWQSPEYADLAVLESVNLCDTVHVYYPKLNVEASAKVIATEWDVINERYNSISLGDARSTLDSVIVSQAGEEAKEATGFLDSYIDALSMIITQGMGLFSTKVPKANGGVQYFLHNRPTLADSRYQWTINSGGFAVSQDYGATWSAGIDAQGNAVFNSLAANEVNALTINGATVNGSVIVFDPEGNPVTASRSPLGANGGVLFDGDGDFTVRTATVGITGQGDGTGQEVQIVGYSNGVLRNMIQMLDGIMTLSHYNTGGGGVVISLSDTGGLGIHINGVGYDNLGFVSDGNGHAVLGK